MRDCGCVAETVAPGSPLADDYSEGLTLPVAPPIRAGVGGVPLCTVGLGRVTGLGKRGLYPPGTPLTSGEWRCSTTSRGTSSASVLNTRGSSLSPTDETVMPVTSTSMKVPGICERESL